MILSTTTKFPQKPAVVPKEDPQHPGDREDNLTVRNIQQEFLAHPLAPFFNSLGMTGGTETAGPAGEHQESFLSTIGTADAGEPAARVTAIEVALDDILDDGPEEAVLLLESALVLRKEPVEVMKQNPVECSALGMSGTIHSRHSGRRASRNGPRL
jgi:hypothetical protein